MGAPQYEQAGADIGGTGTTNTIPRWTGPSTLGDSVITQSGSFIGIGTVSPGARLHVSDNSSIPVIVQSSGSTDSYLRFINTSNNLGYIGYVGTNLYLAPNNGAGNVGIGTASPGFKCVVADTVAGVVTSEIRNDSTNSAATARLRFTTQGGESWIEAFRNAGGALSFATLSTERARIDSAGRMCIGTTTATAGRALTTVADLDVFGVRVGRGPGDIATNTAIGAGALSFCTTGSENTVLGQNAGFGISTGVRNVMIGVATGSGGTVTGSRNIVVGRQAGNQLTSGSDNVLLGNQAGDSITTGNSNIVIGSGADVAAAGDSNQFVLGDATNYVATNGGATTYYATAGASLGYIRVRLNGTFVKIQVFADV